MMSIDVQKLSVLHVAKAQLGLDDDVYREVLFRIAGVRSSKHLDNVGFNSMMAEFERLGFRHAKSRTQNAQRKGFATPAQLGRIRALWKKRTGSYDEKALSVWLFKRFHVSNIRFLESHQAGAAVAILDRIINWPRDRKREAG